MRPSGTGAQRQVLHRRETPLQNLQHRAMPRGHAQLQSGPVQSLRRQRVQRKKLYVAAVFRPE